MECAKDYQVVIADDGKLAFIIPAQTSEPGHAELIYNGSDSALLYRKPGDILVLDRLHEKAQFALKTARNVVVIEADYASGLTVCDYPAIVIQKNDF